MGSVQIAVTSVSGSRGFAPSVSGNLQLAPFLINNYLQAQHVLYGALAA
jgi:hypothetical protein